jgi:hypothetical protein
VWYNNTQGGITRLAGKRSYFDFIEVTQGLGALTYSTGWAFAGKSAACAPDTVKIPAADPKNALYWFHTTLPMVGPVELVY